ncbi:proton extrusion protein PcxA [Microseira sp. BLCC-F43]|uniref:proton extrusion protein PcxA n=1 Tax=Microseira sp. BLCC-F43 TaxID=3153602 RepID=UPI0035B9AFBF
MIPKTIYLPLGTPQTQPSRYATLAAAATGRTPPQSITALPPGTKMLYQASCLATGARTSDPNRLRNHRSSSRESVIIPRTRNLKLWRICFRLKPRFADLDTISVMTNSILQKIKASVRSTNQWFSETPQRSLEQAYNAALQIKAIEDEHFNGQKISPDSADYGARVMAYFQAELNKYLNIAKLRLAAFNATYSVLTLVNQNPVSSNQFDPATRSTNSNRLGARDQPTIILEKLKFIDYVISKYTAETRQTKPESSLSLTVVPQNVKLEASQLESTNLTGQVSSEQSDIIVDKIENISDQTGVLPRSILRTFTRLTRELNPKAEEDVVKKFRTSQAKTAISLRFILLLIVIPLLTFQISKLFVVGPIVDRNFKSPQNPIGIFLNEEQEEKALLKLQRFEEKLKFDVLIGQSPELSPEIIEERIKDKAKDLADEYGQNSADAIKNVFSDLFSIAAFCFVILRSRREIEILKSFIDEIVYGLSDSAKAFIIILFTDMFVGFHSPHGWEVILEGVSRHWGLPENRQFIFLFIATFPVVLDTIFKYWIFRYLNRISPSAVATYRNMNE